MTTFEELCAVAFKKEHTAARRLAKDMDLSLAEALKQTLEKVAGDRPLGELVLERRLIQIKSAESLSLRRQNQMAKREKKDASIRPDPSAWLAWFDGATRPNPGKMGIGGFLKSPQGVRTDISFSAGHGDSSEAEFLALIAVLEEALRHQPLALIVYGDSRVVIDEMAGITTIVAANLQTHIERAKSLLSQLNAVTVIWIPRKRNFEADALSQRALLA
jgi:ribonuclease HI